MTSLQIIGATCVAELLLLAVMVWRKKRGGA